MQSPQDDPTNICAATLSPLSYHLSQAPPLSQTRRRLVLGKWPDSARLPRKHVRRAHARLPRSSSSRWGGPSHSRRPYKMIGPCKVCELFTAVWAPCPRPRASSGARTSAGAFGAYRKSRGAAAAPARPGAPLPGVRPRIWTAPLALPADVDPLVQRDRSRDSRVPGNFNRLLRAAGLAHHRYLGHIDLLVICAARACILRNRPTDAVEQLRSRRHVGSFFRSHPPNRTRPKKFRPLAPIPGNRFLLLKGGGWGGGKMGGGEKRTFSIGPFVRVPPPLSHQVPPPF